jgi:hypothetical protein
MTVEKASTASQGQPTDAAGQAVEAAHLIGSGVLTGGIAVALTLIAIPVSLGVGLAWSARAIVRRVQGN